MSPQKGRGETVLAQGWHHGLEKSKKFDKVTGYKIAIRNQLFSVCQKLIINNQNFKHQTYTYRHMCVCLNIISNSNKNKVHRYKSNKTYIASTCRKIQSIKRILSYLNGKDIPHWQIERFSMVKHCFLPAGDIDFMSPQSPCKIVCRDQPTVFKFYVEGQRTKNGQHSDEKARKELNERVGMNQFQD